METRTSTRSSEGPPEDEPYCFFIKLISIHPISSMATTGAKDAFIAILNGAIKDATAAQTDKIKAMFVALSSENRLELQAINSRLAVIEKSMNSNMGRIDKQMVEILSRLDNLDRRLDSFERRILTNPHDPRTRQPEIVAVHINEFSRPPGQLNIDCD